MGKCVSLPVTAKKIMNHSASKAQELAKEHRHDVEKHLEELEQHTKLAEHQRSEHFSAVARQARLSNHSGDVLQRSKELQQLEQKVAVGHEQAQQKGIDETFEFHPSKTAQIHQEIVQIRKELHEVTDKHNDMVDLLKDELKQAKAAEQRREHVKSKVPFNLDDRIEHVQDQHVKHDIEKVLDKSEAHKSHENQVSAADARRAALMNQRINKAKYLSTHEQQ